MTNENKTELKHDFSGRSGAAFKAILDKAKELGIIERLSLHHLNKMSEAVLNARPNAGEGGDNKELLQQCLNKSVKMYSEGFTLSQLTEGTFNHIISKTRPDPRIKEAVEMIAVLQKYVQDTIKGDRAVERSIIQRKFTKIKTTLEG